MLYPTELLRHGYFIWLSPKKLELESCMKFLRGERCNDTLGGGCSILLSYGDVCLIILSKNNPIVKWESKSETRRIWQKITEKHTHDLLTAAYTVQSVLGGKHMENKDATQLDIDDLIFDQEDGGASQR